MLCTIKLKLCYGKLSLHLRQGKKEYAPRLTRRGSSDVPAHFSSVLSFYGTEMLCLVS